MIAYLEACGGDFLRAHTCDFNTGVTQVSHLMLLGTQGSSSDRQLDFATQHKGKRVLDCLPPTPCHFPLIGMFNGIKNILQREIQQF